MQLTEDQKQAVKKWVEEGIGLSDIQKRLSADFGLVMTYMDVRFLVLDLGLAVKDRKKPVPVLKPDLARPPAQEADADSEGPEEEGFEEERPPARRGAGSVSVEVNRLSRPGAVISGKVTFSDGVSADWWLDQFGRLAVDPAIKSYKPSPQDVQDFQVELRKLLQSRGF
jgi:hypothetical protein